MISLYLKIICQCKLLRVRAIYLRYNSDSFYFTLRVIMQDKDMLRRFLFDNLAIRGEWLNLSDSWLAAKQYHAYPELVTLQLGEALVASTLLSATVKFSGNLILQAEGDGALKALVAQSTHTREIRGWARCEQDVPEGSLSDLLGNGRIIITIEPSEGEPYQGIVSFVGESLASAVEAYFTQSEQLKTRLWIFANKHHAAGLLIQALPTEQNSDTEENWQRIEALADTVTEKELLNLPCEEMLHRLFNEEQLRLFDAEPVSFKCRCSTEKVETTLVSLGREAVDDILKAQDEIIADCEFCSHQYHFDKVDIARIFSNAIVQPHSVVKH